MFLSAKRPQKNERRIVYHARQKVTEAYLYTTDGAWILVSKFVADDWEAGTFDYVELIHDMPNKNRAYGMHIVEGY